jgi:hypothetical protein
MALFLYDVYDFTVDAGYRSQHAAEAHAQGIFGMNAKVTEHSSGGTATHAAAMGMLNVAVANGLKAPIGFIVPRTPGPSIDAQIDVAISKADQYMPGWRTWPLFAWQVDLEHWSYDSVAPNWGVEMCKRLMQRTQTAAFLYAPKWAYGDTVPDFPGRKLWASNYSGSGSPRNYRDMYLGPTAPGWVSYSGAKPVLNQYCSDGRVGSYPNNLVMTAFEGSEADYKATLESALAPYLTGPSRYSGVSPSPGVPVAELSINAGVVMDSVGLKLKAYLEGKLPADLIAKLYITSNNRGTSGVDYHSDPGSNGALDVAGQMNETGQRAMQAAARLIIEDHLRLLELIHSTPYADDNGFYVKNGVVQGPGFYGSATEQAHVNHIHIAASEAAAAALVTQYPKSSSPVPGGPVAESVDLTFDPYGRPAHHIENRGAGVLLADLWGEEHFGSSPYDKSVSVRQLQLNRLEAAAVAAAASLAALSTSVAALSAAVAALAAKVDEIETPTAEVDYDSVVSACKTAIAGTSLFPLDDPSEPS